ncbi:LOW QUALITY PROTEIN: protein scribble homolog [Liolophura sinensis]|uniref:LOW QUALITY PROTEIN: protein scribble homolog n=1 Tax=Liolophura sinensis TaxID=3198878 RepID=UPI003158E0C6
MFKCIPLFRACNRQVEYIDRRHCNLTSVPDDVLRYTRSLEELLLDANQIRELPRGFFRLVQLAKLGLSDNEISRLPPDVANFMNLVELDIRNNVISEIPDNIKFCKKLQVLDFSSNPLSKLPDGLTQLRNLTHLGLNDVSLARLPPDISKLCNLVSLELRENMIKTLPSSLSSLNKLQSLDLGNNEIEELPETIGNLPCLEELWLDCNELCDLPVEIGKLKRLTQLDVSENRLEVLPDEISGLQSLTDLFLSQNSLECLPDTIGQLKKLSILKVDQNRLLVLTPHIGSCESMQELILTENLLNDLPITIGKLSQLANLNVDRNRLTELPIEIGRLSKLGVLSLRENRLLRLPQELGELKSLHVMDVSGNRLEYLPITVANLNLQALWLSENQAKPMLKFQTDFDERTGQEVLTCFLLPQQGFHTESMENLLRGSVATDQDSRLSWSERNERPRDSVIRFAEEGGEEVASDDDESPFIRHDTPHPRDLKARHAKLFHKSKGIDGHIIPKDQDSKDKDRVFLPQRDSDPRWSSQDHDSMDNVDFGDRKSSIEIAKKEPERVRKEHPAEYEERPKVSMTPVATVIAPAPASDAEKAEKNEDETEERHSQHEDSEDEGHERTTRVGFSPDVDEQANKDHRLRRRDTPHHLKNKRINLSGDRDDAKKVQEILAQAAAAKETPGELAGEPTVTATIIPGEERLPTAELVEGVSDDELVEEEELSIDIHRAPGQGLGISIAGGKGSTPYKGDDESVFISRVTEDGPAEQCGVRVGDRLLAVNGIDLSHADHYEAVDVLKSAGNSINMIIGREKPIEKSPEEFGKTGSATVTFTPEPDMEVKTQTISTTLDRDQHGLGFSIAGGRGSVPYKGNDNIYSFLEAIYISRVVDGGAAQQDGKLRIGDRIISINGIDMSDARHDQAVALLTGLDRKIDLVVQREELVPKENTGPSVQTEDVTTNKQPVTPQRVTWNQSSHTATRFAPTITSQSPVTINQSTLQSSPATSPPSVSQSHTLQLHATPTVQFQAPPPSSSPSSQSSSSWKPPAMTTVQPPRFHYPGFSRTQPATNSADVAPSPVVSPPQPYAPSVTMQSSPVVRPVTLEREAAPLSQTLPNDSSPPVRETSTNASTITVYRDTVTKPAVDVVNHVSELAEHVHPYPVEEITICKGGGPLGLSIVGGSDHSSQPFGADQPGVFISKIVPDGAAAKTKLKIGDRVLSVNGKDITTCTHQEAVMALISPAFEINLIVRHDPPPDDLEELTILKKPGEKLGMSIKGGSRSYPGNPLDKSDEGIFISKINDDGAVARDGRLSVGQRILEVNGQSLLGASHQEAVRALRSVSEEMRIMVCHGYDPMEIEVSSPTTPLGGMLERSHHDSLSSIDKDDEEHLIIKQERLRQEREHLQGLDNSHPSQNRTEPSPEKDSISSAHLTDHVTSVPHVPPKPKFRPTLPPKPVAAVVRSPSEEENLDPIRQARLPAAKHRSVAMQPGTYSQFTSPNVVASPKKAEKEEIFDPRKEARKPSASLKGQGDSAGIPEHMSIIQRKKFFEKEIEQLQKPPQTQKKQFSYLADHEIARMKQEEEQKACSMTQQELLSYVTGQEEDAEQPEYDKVLSSQSNINSIQGQVRTAKAEKRMQERLKTLWVTRCIADGERKLSPADERALQAEKRAAWRKARMKSLEDEALRAQAVITKAQERSMTTEEAKVKANTMSAVDIAFADEEEEVSGKQNGQNNSQSNPIDSRSSKKLVIHLRDGDTTTKETERLVGEKVSNKTEEYVDDVTGQTRLRTVQVVEKTIEKEVEVTKQQIIELSLEDKEPSSQTPLLSQRR